MRVRFQEASLQESGFNNMPPFTYCGMYVESRDIDYWLEADMRSRWKRDNKHETMNPVSLELRSGPWLKTSKRTQAV